MLLLAPGWSDHFMSGITQLTWAGIMRPRHRAVKRNRRGWWARWSLRGLNQNRHFAARLKPCPSTNPDRSMIPIRWALVQSETGLIPGQSKWVFCGTVETVPFHESYWSVILIRSGRWGRTRASWFLAKWAAELCSAWTLRLRSGQAREGARPHTSMSTSDISFYWRWVEAPAARSRRTPRKVAAARSSVRASRSMVAARCGESGRKRTLSRLCPREVIRVLITGGSSCLHAVQVVSTTGPGRTTVQLRDLRTSLLSL